MNYSKMLDKVSKFRDKYKGKLVANNTRIYMDAETEEIRVKLHRTDILTFTKENLLIIYMGGWDTNTTKDRINMYSPIAIWQLGMPYNASEPIVYNIETRKLVKNENEGIVGALVYQLEGYLHKQGSPRYKPVYADRIKETKKLLNTITDKYEVDTKTIERKINADKEFIKNKKAMKGHNFKVTKQGELVVLEKECYYLYDTLDNSTTQCYYSNKDIPEICENKTKEYENDLAIMLENKKLLDSIAGLTFLDKDNTKITFRITNSFNNTLERKLFNLDKAFPMVVVQEGYRTKAKFGLLFLKEELKKYTEFSLLNSLEGQYE